MHPRPVPFPPFFLASTFLLALAAMSCAAVVHQPLLAPDKGGRAWREVHSEHFVLKTDLDADDAQKASAKLEEMFAALADLGFASAQRPSIRVDVVYFRSHEDYAELAPKLTSASFYPEGHHDFEKRPFALIGGDFVQAARESLQHELTHLFVHYYYPQIPTWLNEGLAQYLETMSIEDGVVILGRQARSQRFWKGPHKAHYDPAGWTFLLPMSEAPTPVELRRMTREEFYGNRDSDPRTSDGAKAFERMAIHYEAAATLVRLFLTNDAYSDAFAKYLGRIHDGDQEEAAWQDTIGRIPEDRLAKDYEAALVPNEVMLERAKWSAPAFQAESPTPLSDAQVHVLWARLRPDTSDGARAAQADLEAASKLGSSDGDAEFALVHAYWLAASRQIGEAEAAINAALAEHADDPRLWNALGKLTMADFADETGHFSPDGQKRLAGIADHLTPLAATPSQLDLLASIVNFQGKADAALTYEKRAVAADPNCVSCLTQAAQILFAQGHVREALETATLAQGLAPEGRRAPRAAALIEACRKKLGK